MQQIDSMSSCPMSGTSNRHGNRGLGRIPYRTMTEISKIKLSEDDFVLVGMNYNYYMVPRLAHTKDNLEGLKQQILKNQKMIEELRTIWNEGEHGMVTDDVAGVMEKYFGNRTQ